MKNNGYINVAIILYVTSLLFFPYLLFKKQLIISFRQPQEIGTLIAITVLYKLFTNTELIKKKRLNVVSELKDSNNQTIGDEHEKRGR